MAKLAKKEAREWIREHFATYIENSDCGMDCPIEVLDIWDDECRKIAGRLRGGKSLAERIAEADERGSRYLSDANEATERGHTAMAEKLYEKGQHWLDRSNKLRGNG